MMQTMIPRKHTDGGTYIEIAFSETRERWGINITRWTTYRGTTVFEINRVSPEGKMLRLDKRATEAEARQVANAAWKRDR